MSRAVWFATGTGVLAGLVACGGEDLSRVLPSVEVQDGVEIATLAALPDFSDPAYQWTFRVLESIPTVTANDERPLVFDARSLLPLPDGSLLIHDHTAAVPLVQVGPSRRSPIRRIGRSGEGPGEMGPWLTLAAREAGFVVFDGSNRQLHAFSRDGQATGSTRLELSSTGSGAQAAAGGFLLNLLRRGDDEWHRELAWVDPLTGRDEFVARLPTPSARAEPGRIQSGRVLWRVVGDAVVAMWSDRPVVTVYSMRGTRLRELRLPLERRQLTKRDIQEQIEHYGGIARSLEPGPAALTNELYAVGDTVFGLFTSALWRSADDPAFPAGQIWWRLFSVGGEYVGVVRIPDGFRALGASERGLWARVLDESGYPIIQELEIVRSGQDSST